VETEDAAYQLERILHLVFATSRLSSLEICGGRGREDGDTEWFSIDCMEKVCAFLSSNQGFIACQPVGLEWICSSEVTKQSMVEEERAAQKAAKIAAKAERDKIRQARQEARDRSDDEILAVCLAEAQSCLADLLNVTSRAALIADVKKRWRILVFSAASDQSEAIVDRMNELSFRSDLACIAIVSGTWAHEDAKTGAATYAMTLVWPDESEHVGIFKKVGEGIAKLQPGVEGWDLPLSDDAAAWAAKFYRDVTDDWVDRISGINQRDFYPGDTAENKKMMLKMNGKPVIAKGAHIGFTC
jgi:hypothetical protein